MVKNSLKISLIFSFFCISIIDSQELNTDYLSSLPPEIQADVLKNIAQQADTKAELYRGPKTTVLQLDTALQQIKLQLNEIENELSDNQSSIEPLRRFGHNFFRSFQSSFSPLSIPNLSEDYIVDVGDIFDVTLVGQINESIADLPVAKDGSLTISNLGKFQVAGLTLKQVSDLVNASVQQKIVGQETFLTLADIRDINILIVGNIKFPGMYTISGNSNILYALDMAGGPSENGSFRAIELKRENKTILQFDLYDVFINGNINFKNYLKAGDVILVNPKGKEVSVSGGVSNPAIYELLEKETLYDALNYAKISKNSNSDILTIQRRLKDKTSIFKVSIDGSKSMQAENADNIFVDFIKIKNVPLKTVEIKGEVLNPGIYPISSDDTISSLIKRAGGYRPNAYEFGASLFRQSSISVEKAMNEKIYRDMITYLAAAARSTQSASSGTLPLLLTEFKNVEPLGRVTTEFNLDKLANDRSSDINLQDGDIISIPQYSPEVFVFGEVLKPGSKSYDVSSDINDYIDFSGGTGILADKNRIILIHPNGDTFLHSAPFKLFRGNNLEIYPGSIIYVPRRIGKIEGINYASTVAPIFSSLALSLASLNSISD